ncbi:hypothetical protein [Streptomyces niveus]|uniref:hypothetical protein n=1 Tax=Streptomyces niveus TaxID=193462 RepID=UPI0034321AD8
MNKRTTGQRDAANDHRWSAPPPAALPSWKQRQERFTRSNLSIEQLAVAIRNDAWSILPVPATPEPAIHAEWAAKVLASQESLRLEEARTYSFGSNATGMAVAAATGAPPQEQVSLSRLPSPSGLMVFADPIGHYSETVVSTYGRELEIHTPIVAASWSVWGREQMQPFGPDAPIAWLVNAAEGPVVLDGMTGGIWVTFYSARPSDRPSLRDDAPVGVVDGMLVTAATARQNFAEVARRNADVWGPMHWHDEVLLPVGATFPKAPQSGTPRQWASVLYTAWQMMQQSGTTQLVDVKRHNVLPPAARKKAKAKAKQSGLGPAVGDGAVYVVDLTFSQSPPQADVERDAAASDGRRTVEWKFRWNVPPYRRMTCTNPYLHHKLDDSDLKYHEHREDLLPGATKGPKDKPLREQGGTTYKFETPPDAQ